MTKPTVAFIRQEGLSAAYQAATGADFIIAERSSWIGSIGITMSYLDNVEKNKKDGFTFNQLSIGQFKDAGSPDKPLTEEERKALNTLLEESFNVFVDEVAFARNLPREDVLVLADGLPLSSQKALAAGLIDVIGGMQNVRAYLASELGTNTIVFCDPYHPQ